MPSKNQPTFAGKLAICFAEKTFFFSAWSSNKFELQALKAVARAAALLSAVHYAQSKHQA